jgi:hypothetical protein
MFPKKIGYVITTIQSLTNPVIKLAGGMDSVTEMLFLIGDEKTPSISSPPPGIKYFSPEDQLKLNSELALVLPWNSYGRKMVGYQLAIENDCHWIRETDDDNYPLESFFDPPSETLKVRSVRSIINQFEWLNCYSFFTDQYVWPRGYPIELLSGEKKNGRYHGFEIEQKEVSGVVIQQGLANGEPDLDALFRMLISDDIKMTFDEEIPLLLPKGAYCPFNSQATLWNSIAFPLMYLPLTCTFRMTDIWRSFIAERILRETNYSIIFTSPTVYQERNPHNFHKDFIDEIPGYSMNNDFVMNLNKIPISGGEENFLDDITLIYRSMIDKGFFKPVELTYLSAWKKLFQEKKPIV